MHKTNKNMLPVLILSLLLSSSLAINFLEIPAITSSLVDHINSAQSSWVAHNNPRFSTLTLSEAKSMMGTFLNDPFKPPVKLENGGNFKINQKNKKHFNYKLNKKNKEK